MNKIFNLGIAAALLGFASVTQAVTISVQPNASPIVIPATGGQFTYNGKVSNPDSVAGTWDIWTVALVPGLGEFGPLQKFSNVTLQGGQSAEKAGIVVNVPAEAPAGLYSFVAYAGTYPSVTLARSTFQFIKEGVCPSLTGNWTIYYDWGCDGGPGNHNMIFNIDGSWVSSEGYTGTWTQTGCKVDYVYQSGTHYWGDISTDGNSLKGEQTAFNGLTGCWTGTRNAPARTLVPSGLSTTNSNGAPVKVDSFK